MQRNADERFSPTGRMDQESLSLPMMTRATAGFSLNAFDESVGRGV
ncbi:MAG: hypothetical protein P1U58_10710 [Verrucomicrobiales bacterium]|nr:hypothetical protein [Verrucomicrobiales bacterium]